MILDPLLIRSTEIVAALLGAAYVVLAARRNRACWLAGALSAALASCEPPSRRGPVGRHDDDGLASTMGDSVTDTAEHSIGEAAVALGPHDQQVGALAVSGVEQTGPGGSKHKKS